MDVGDVVRDLGRIEDGGVCEEGYLGWFSQENLIWDIKMQLPLLRYVRSYSSLHLHT